MGLLNNSLPFLFCNFSLFSSKKSTNSITPPSNLNSIIFFFFLLASIKIILIPLFINVYYLILLIKIFALNFIEENISLDGKKVI